MTWFVMYDGPARDNGYGQDEKVFLFDDLGAAKELFDELKAYLLKQGQWESGREDGGHYFIELDSTQIMWCSHIGLWMGEAEWPEPTKVDPEKVIVLKKADYGK